MLKCPPGQRPDVRILSGRTPGRRDMGRRNPILVVGEPMRKGVFWMSDELVRSGAHDDALGSDGFVVMAFLLSWATTPNKRPWETSAAQMSDEFGWGINRHARDMP